MAQAQPTLASHIFSVERRRALRTDITIYTYVRLPDDKQVPIEIVNASSGGVMARCSSLIAEGTKVRVELPNMGWIAAKVVWSFGEQHGLSFDAPIDEFYIDMLIQMHLN